MDISKALYVTGAVFGLIEFGKRFLGPRLARDPRIVAALALAAGQAGVWLVAKTVWAHEQVIGSKPLDELNTGSLILVGLMIAGAAAFGSEVVAGIRNIGQNQLTPIQKDALDLGAERLVAAQLAADAGGSHPTPDPLEGVNFPDA